MNAHALTWGELAGRLSGARSYWLATTMPSGAPHAVPVWGAVVGGTLYLYSERKTVKARNLAADPRAVVHLESGEDVLIVHGTAENLGPPSRVPPLVTALAAKYTRPGDWQYLPAADPGFDVAYAIRPRTVLTWDLSDFDGSQRRWSP
jgi:PPOX class probable F420-dependent enzyme